MRPVTSQEVAVGITVQVRAGLVPIAVTVYDVGVGPEEGGVTVTVADVVEVTTAVGAPGVLGGASGADAVDGDDEPIELVAIVVNV